MIKRIIDLTISSILLLLFLPLMLLIAIVIACTMGTPVIFRQQRPGLHGRLFTMCKFRSMSNERDSNGELLPDSERLTSTGQFLNKTRLDELPEFYNVLKGDMSIVGPRPLLAEFLEKYTPEQARRHNVRPGLTGLAQVTDISYMPISKKLELDTQYADNQSLWLDFKIMMATIPKVIGSRGVDPYPASVEKIDDLGFSSQGKLKLQGQKGGSRPGDEG